MNTAIGDEDTYVTLIDLSEDAASTLSKKVVDTFGKNFNWHPVDETKIPSIKMKKLCENYFYRRPLFLNLDI